MASRETRVRVPLPSRALGLVPPAALALDSAIIVLAALVAAIGRDTWGVFESRTMVRETLGMAGPVIVGLWVLCIALVGGYSKSLFDAGTAEFTRVLRGSLLAAGLVGVVAVPHQQQLSRGFFLLAFAIGIPALLVGRLVLRAVINGARRRGSFRHTVLIAGTAGAVDDVARVLRRETQLGYRVAGALTPSGTAGDETPLRPPDRRPERRGGRHRPVSRCRRRVLRRTAGVASAREMRQIAWDLEDDDVQVDRRPAASPTSPASGSGFVRSVGCR